MSEQITPDLDLSLDEYKRWGPLKKYFFNRVYQQVVPLQGRWIFPQKTERTNSQIDHDNDESTVFWSCGAHVNQRKPTWTIVPNPLNKVAQYVLICVEGNAKLIADNDRDPRNKSWEWTWSCYIALGMVLAVWHVWNESEWYRIRKGSAWRCTNGLSNHQLWKPTNFTSP